MQFEHKREWIPVKPPALKKLQPILKHPPSKKKPVSAPAAVEDLGRLAGPPAAEIPAELSVPPGLPLQRRQQLRAGPFVQPKDDLPKRSTPSSSPRRVQTLRTLRTSAAQGVSEPMRPQLLPPPPTNKALQKPYATCGLGRVQISLWQPQKASRYKRSGGWKKLAHVLWYIYILSVEGSQAWKLAVELGPSQQLDWTPPHQPASHGSMSRGYVYTGPENDPGCEMVSATQSERL